MKTLAPIRTSMVVLVSGLFAATAFAGPGPQYWNKVSSRPADKPAPTRMDEHPTGKCDGCKTTPIWVVSDRGPAGKGLAGAHIRGTSHSCTGCVGKNVTENGVVKSHMKHAAGCVTLVCCK